MKKLLKKSKVIYTKSIFWVIFIFGISLNLYLIYKFNSNKIILTILIITFVLMFISSLIWNYNHKLRNNNQHKKIVSINKNKIDIFIKDNNNFYLDKKNVKYIIYYKENPIMETLNWKTFTPRKNKKTRIKIDNINEVIKYLKRLKAFN